VFPGAGSAVLAGNATNGGIGNPDQLRSDENAVDFVQELGE
jgi:hypothetical protein